MSTFTLTSPEGKTYEVEGPEGATQEQAYSMLQQQLASKPKAQTAGAAAAEPPRPQDKTIEERGKEVAAGTAFGAVAGALMPEIVTGAGMGMVGLGAAVPPAAPFLIPAGGATIAAGRGMRAGRVLMAAQGALSGMVSETAGQSAEALGAGKGTALAVRLGAGVATPTSLGAIKDFVSAGGSKLVRLVHSFSRELGEGEAKAATQAAERRIQQTILTGKPAHDVYEAISQGLAHDAAAAEAAGKATVAKAYRAAGEVAATNPKRAAEMVTQAEREAQELRSAAKARADVLNKASKGAVQNAAKVNTMAEGELAKVAPHVPLSDIGGKLQQQAGKVNAAELASRTQEYQRVLQERNAVVAAREGRGEFVVQLPESQKLLAEIDKKLLLTQGGRKAAAGVADVKEAGVAGAYQRVYDALKSKRLQTGVDATGNPTFTTFKTSFEALDHVRRKLGDVAFGKEVEGYSGLGQGLAKELYGKISTIQEKFAGPVQRELQSGYAAATGELGKFGTKAGEKLTEVERADPMRFMTDPASIPGDYFRTQRGVQDLKHLVGDTAMVEQAAKEYAVGQIAGRNVEQAEKWLGAEAQKDWMREVPGLQASMKGYVERLRKIEAAAGKAEGAATAMRAEAAGVAKKTGGMADRLVAEAKLKAAEMKAGRLKRVGRATAGGVAGVAATAGGKAAGLVGEGE